MDRGTKGQLGLSFWKTDQSSPVFPRVNQPNLAFFPTHPTRRIYPQVWQPPHSRGGPALRGRSTRRPHIGPYTVQSLRPMLGEVRGPDTSSRLGLGITHNPTRYHRTLPSR